MTDSSKGRAIALLNRVRLKIGGQRARELPLLVGREAVVVDISDAHGLTFGVVLANLKGMEGRSAEHRVWWVEPEEVEPTSWNYPLACRICKESKAVCCTTREEENPVCFACCPEHGLGARHFEHVPGPLSTGHSEPVGDVWLAARELVESWEERGFAFAGPAGRDAMITTIAVKLWGLRPTTAADHRPDCPQPATEWSECAAKVCDEVAWVLRKEDRERAAKGADACAAHLRGQLTRVRGHITTKPTCVLCESRPAELCGQCHRNETPLVETTSPDEDASVPVHIVGYAHHVDDGTQDETDRLEDVTCGICLKDALDGKS